MLVAAVVLGVIVVVALAVVGVGASPSGPQVRSGWPLVWAVQDQSALSPPPGTAVGAAESGRLLSPWEHPTRVDGGGVAVDVVVVGGCWLVVAGVMALLWRPRRRRSSTMRTQ